MGRDVVEKAYQLINEPIDPNLRCPLELEDIVDYKEAEPGETVEYFASDRSDVDDIYTVDSNGGITFHKVALGSVTALTFTGLQSKLETILIDEILNSKDQTALAAKKDGIIRAMDKKEVKTVLDLCLGLSSQKVTKATGEDLLDVIIKMKQKISNYATDYILLVGSSVADEIEKYDKDNAKTFNYKMSINEELAKLGIKKVVKVIGEVNSTPVLAADKAILIGRDSSLAKGRPIKFLRRKFAKEIAELSGAKEGAVRLVSIAKTPTVINADGKNTLGYAAFGYESILAVVTNYRAISWSDEIIA